MRRHFVAFAGIALAVMGESPAQAAPAFSWTGFYIGAHAGYGWGSQSWHQTSNNQGNPSDNTTDPARLNSALGGAQAGYNFQSGPWVYGLEADWSWTGASGCAGDVIFTQYQSCSKASWYATATGRIGHVFGAELVFLRAGAAFTGQKHDSTFLGGIDTEETRNVTTGWIAGGGIEHSLAPNWSVKAEYDYMDFGTKDTPLTYLASGSSPGLLENWNIKFHVHVVKIGINYLFDRP